MPLQRPSESSWVTGDHPLTRLIARPLRDFLATEASGGIVLLIAALLALVWANSPAADSYEALWSTEISLRVGGWELSEDLRHWVNDGLMAIFFFVVGLEIKRELVVGHLSSLRRAILPAIAALGGMVMPALIYLAINNEGESVRGWGIPMATDIAFAVGVLAVLGPRIPNALKIFLLSIAIADDIGAIAVIAGFYSGGIAWNALAAALALLLVIIVIRNAGVRWLPVYVVLGIAVWLATLESGVHATIAGVALGLVTPARPLRTEEQTDVGLGPAPSPADVHSARVEMEESISVAERLEHELHPFTSYLVIPVFALANAGVQIGGEGFAATVSSPVTFGIVAGLVAGKLAGITLFTWAAVRLRLGVLAEDITWSHVAGAAAVAGIGFTVSLFISGLAFATTDLVEEAKIGILTGSFVAAVIGILILRRAP